MTEKRAPREQIASHSYRRQTPGQSSSAARPEYRRESLSQGNRRDAHRTPQESSRTLQRVVTIPEADPSTAWNTFAQRQEQMRRARSRPQRYIESVPRTYAQTGMHASSGRLKAVRPAQASYNNSPVPMRSGARRARRGILWRILSIFSVVVVGILAANFAFTSNAFRIEQVSVVGTHNAALIQNIQRMGMQGQNIFLIDVAALTNRVEEYPLVASASLSKQWPNLLLVTVVERTPVMLWQTAQGTYSVDGQGVVIAPASETTGADHLMTVVDTSRQGKGSMGKTLIHSGVRLSQADVAFTMEVFDRLPRVTGITAFKLRYDGTMYPSTTDGQGRARTSSSGGSYVVESPNGWLAYLGDAHDSNPLDNRLLELQQILSMAQQQQLNLATIDLRYGLHPVYTVK